MNRRSFLSALSRLGAAVVASPLAALLPTQAKPIAHLERKRRFENWKNYTTEYVHISKEELLAAWRAAYDKMEWKPPYDSQPLS